MDKLRIVFTSSYLFSDKDQHIDNLSNDFGHGHSSLLAKRYPATALAVTGFKLLITNLPMQSIPTEKNRGRKAILGRYFKTRERFASRVSLLFLRWLRCLPLCIFFRHTPGAWPVASSNRCGFIGEEDPFFHIVAISNVA